MRVSNYIANTLAKFGAKHVFMVTGGGSMHLNYSLSNHPNLMPIFNHHEQACSMAAEAYARITNQPSIINVTTGPGSVNALNGVYGAYTDSIPMIILSGQVKRETYIGTYDLPELRQLGDQEIDIIAMVKRITKYSTTIFDPQTIRFHLEKAWYIAKSGRPGPCWLDIPIDVQSSDINENSILGFDKNTEEMPVPVLDTAQIDHTLDKLRNAKRPVILAGTGVRLADAIEIFNRVVQKLGIPVTTGWTHDLISSDNPVFVGRAGTIGTRSGNIAVQNSDVLLIIGNRLNIRQTGYAYQSFAREAFKIWVDIDPAELNRPTVKPDLPINCDARKFLEQLDKKLATWDKNLFSEWMEWCKKRQSKYPAVLNRHREFNGKINPYHFMEVLFDNLTDDDVVVTGNATACIVSFQVANIKLGQRLFSNSGSASMGYDLPAAIGAAVARGGKRVICLAGDGSLQMNIQELQTLSEYKFPIKIFILNNNGYLSIRSSQLSFFGKSFGESPATNVSFPNFKKIAYAYNIPYERVQSNDFSKHLINVIHSDGPVICEVILDPEQGFEPRQSSRELPDGRIVSAPLEDMFPFLTPDELKDNLLIAPWEG